MHPVINIFGLQLPSYGVMAGLGLIAGVALFMLTKKKYALNWDTITSALLYAVIGGFIGAKLLYIIVEWNAIFHSQDMWKSLLNTGFVFYGGLIGAGAMLALYAKKSHRNIFELTDSMLPCFCVSHAIGRIGCFLAGCCYGCQTDSALGVCFPPGGIAPSGVKLLPTQLFEAVFLALLAGALFLIFFKHKHLGLVTGVYLCAYSVWRFIIEFFRTDERGAVGSLSTSQFIGIFIFALGVYVLVKWFNNKKKAAEVPPENE